MRSRSRAPGKIIGKQNKLTLNKIYDLILMKLGQTFYLDIFYSEFESGSHASKTRSQRQILENFVNTIDAT